MLLTKETCTVVVSPKNNTFYFDFIFADRRRIEQSKSKRCTQTISRHTKENGHKINRGEHVNVSFSRLRLESNVILQDMSAAALQPY